MRLWLFVSFVILVPSIGCMVKAGPGHPHPQRHPHHQHPHKKKHMDPALEVQGLGTVLLDDEAAAGDEPF